MKMYFFMECESSRELLLLCIQLISCYVLDGEMQVSHGWNCCGYAHCLSYDQPGNMNLNVLLGMSVSP